MNQRKVANAATHQSSQHLLRLLPNAVIFVMTILVKTDLPIPFIDIVNPLLPIMAIFFFTLWQPQFVSVYMVFACGVMYDGLQSSTLMGTYALLFLLFRLSVGRLWWRTGFIERLLPNWGLFILLALGFFAVEAAILMLQDEGNIIMSALILRNLLTLALYPLMHYALSFMIVAIQSRAA
ncbi:MAG: hypothetical protein F6K62_09900 [Sphaerospermopsis sp. SIO1G2]|nr:hypothetical protein [Sphaerospermopsis sp. SIO1G2]